MKAVAPILGLLLVLAAGIFYLTKPDSGKPPAAATPTTAAPPKAASSPIPRTGDEARKSNARKTPQGDRAMSDTDKRLANVSALLTPIQAELVDSRMRTREPRYRALFDSWGLDPESADQVLEIVRDREAKCTALNLSSYKKGTQAMVETIKKKALEKEAAKAILLPMLGPDRFDELVQLEKQLVAESRERARTMISNANKNVKE